MGSSISSKALSGVLGHCPRPAATMKDEAGRDNGYRFAPISFAIQGSLLYF